MLDADAKSRNNIYLFIEKSVAAQKHNTQKYKQIQIQKYKYKRPSLSQYTKCHK